MKKQGCGILRSLRSAVNHIPRHPLAQKNKRNRGRKILHRMRIDCEITGQFARIAEAVDSSTRNEEDGIENWKSGGEGGIRTPDRAFDPITV
jgi:hypothetical protein